MASSSTYIDEYTMKRHMTYHVEQICLVRDFYGYIYEELG
jgi:hypothetical protein